MFVSGVSFNVLNQLRGRVYIPCPVYELDMAAFAKFPERSTRKCGSFIVSDCFWDAVQVYILFQKSNRRLAVGRVTKACRWSFTATVHRKLNEKSAAPFYVIAPMKSNWISLFSLLSAGNVFFRTRYIRFDFLHYILHGIHPSHFFRIASVIFGHLKCCRH